MYYRIRYCDLRKIKRLLRQPDVISYGVPQSSIVHPTVTVKTVFHKLLFNTLTLQRRCSMMDDKYHTFALEVVGNARRAWMSAPQSVVRRNIVKSRELPAKCR